MRMEARLTAARSLFRSLSCRVAPARKQAAPLVDYMVAAKPRGTAHLPDMQLERCGGGHVTVCSKLKPISLQARQLAFCGTDANANTGCHANVSSPSPRQGSSDPLFYGSFEQESGGAADHVIQKRRIVDRA